MNTIYFPTAIYNSCAKTGHIQKVDQSKSCTLTDGKIPKSLSVIVSLGLQSEDSR